MTEHRTKIISDGPIEERSARFSLIRSGVHYGRAEPMQDYMQELREAAVPPKHSAEILKVAKPK